MKVLIIGYGSIGKRHFEILSLFDKVRAVDILSKQTIPNIKTFNHLDKVPDIQSYDYYVISNETHNHYKYLKDLCDLVSNKKILVEKPLYDKNYDSFKYSNLIFTAYNLRFHPVINKLKSLIEKQKIYYVNVVCGQYLPTWRPEQDYRKSYSADIARGGGVLRDLSHEIDYINFLFGEIEIINSINTKISDLEINSDDIFTAIALTKDKCIVNLTIDYISKSPIRRMIIHTESKTIEADMIKNNIIVYDKNNDAKIIKLDLVDRNFTYTEMHKAILNDDSKDVCTIEEGERIVSLIDKIDFKRL